MLDLLQYTFFQHALWGALLSSILCGMIGTYVVTRRLVFVSGGIAHASLGGVGMGAYMGFSPVLGAAAFAILSAFGIRRLSSGGEVREDSAIGMLWTLGMSIGILFASLSPGFMPDLPSFLFGNILYVGTTDLWVQGALLLVVGAFFAMFMRSIVAVAFDVDFAMTQGIRVERIETAMLVLSALTIVSCLHMMGIVLVISLLSVPQATAGYLTHHFGRLMLYSAAFALLDCVGGLFLSAWLNVPSGASIIVVSVAVYFAVRTIKQVISR